VKREDRRPKREERRRKSELSGVAPGDEAVSSFFALHSSFLPSRPPPKYDSPIPWPHCTGRTVSGRLEADEIAGSCEQQPEVSCEVEAAGDELRELVGQQDLYLRMIQEGTGARLKPGGGGLTVCGSDAQTQAAAQVLRGACWR